MKKNEHPGNSISQKFSHYKLSFLTFFYDSYAIIYLFWATIVEWTDLKCYEISSKTIGIKTVEELGTVPVYIEENLQPFFSPTL